MNTQTAQALQTIIYTLDDEGGELAIEDYLKLLKELNNNLEGRIEIIQIEVEKKIADLK